MPIKTRMALAAALLLGAAPAALIADDTAPIITAQAETYDDDKLDSFIRAAQAMQQVQWRAEQEMINTGAPEERQEIADQAEEEMQAAIEETDGIDLQEYMAILDAAGTDPTLAERLNERLARMQ